VPVQGWESDKAGNLTNDSNWLSHRADLFSKYCLPTVQGQEEKGFIWLIYFDVNTPASYLQAIEEKLHPLSYQIRLVRDFQECVDDLKNIVASSPTPYAITSRLDNDDGIGIHYIRTVQEVFTEEHQTQIILEGGIVYDADKNILTRILHHKNNHYGSIIEKCNPKENLITIMGFAHDRMNTFNTVYVDKPNSWLKIIHARNLKSRMYGMPVTAKSILPFFSIREDHLRVSTLNSLSYILARSFRKMGKKIFRKT
jgi:hypothetical protein